MIIALGIENVIPLEKVVLYLLASSVVILLITLYYCYMDFDHYIRGYARRAVEQDMRVMSRLEAAEQGQNHDNNINLQNE